jgi:hypothetical protein
LKIGTGEWKRDEGDKGDEGDEGERTNDKLLNFER